MDIKEFAELIKNHIEQQEQYKVRITEVTKNNGVVLLALNIFNEDSNVVPNIYLNSFFEMYKDGVVLEHIVGKVLGCYEKFVLREHVDLSHFRDYERVKDSLYVKLINKEANAELLKKMPYMEFADLAAVVYYSNSIPEIVRGSIQIYNSHLTMWGVTREEVFEQAYKNQWEQKSGEYKPMDEIMKEYGVECGAFEIEAMESMLMVSTSDRLYGAVAMIQPNLLKTIAAQWDCDLIILPSSIHEVIVLPEYLRAIEELKEMVRVVNATQVLPEEVLSDNIYRYNRSTVSIEIA